MVIKPSCLKSKDQRQENTNFKKMKSYLKSRQKKKKKPVYLEFLLNFLYKS